MATTTLSSLAHLSDQELLGRVADLAAEERQATALLIACLAELDARRLYLAEGYSSLFTYCTQALHLSEHAAYGRIEAARRRPSATRCSSPPAPTPTRSCGGLKICCATRFRTGIWIRCLIGRCRRS